MRDGEVSGKGHPTSGKKGSRLGRHGRPTARPGRDRSTRSPAPGLQGLRWRGQPFHRGSRGPGEVHTERIGRRGGGASCPPIPRRRCREAPVMKLQGTAASDGVRDPHGPESPPSRRARGSPAARKGALTSDLQRPEPREIKPDGQTPTCAALPQPPPQTAGGCCSQ